MSTSPNEKPIINKSVALQRLGGDEKLLATVAGFFIEDAPMLMSQLESAQAAGSMDLVTHRAHSLKGLSATFEAIPFQAIAAEIELLGRKADRAAIEEKLQRLKLEFDRLLSELEAVAK